MEDFEALYLRAKADFEHYRFLPFAVYLTHKTGVIIEYNEEAMNLLGLDLSDKRSININSFYLQTKERTRLIQKMSGFNDGEWEKNQTLNFKVKGEKISLRYFAKAYLDTEGNFLGSLCLVFQITEFERFRHLEDDMQIGFFEMNADSSINYANKKFKEVLAIDGDSEALKFTDFLPNNLTKEAFEKVVDELKTTEFLRGKEFNLIRQDKMPAVGKIYLIRDEVDQEGNLIKIKGVLEDITFSDILDEVPIGLFSLIRHDKDPLVVGHCNENFSEIFSFSDEGSCIGKEFGRLLNNNEDFVKLEREINSLGTKDNPLQNYYVKSGREGEKDFIIHVKRLPDRNNTQRFAGALYDVTDEVEFRLEGWKQDFASFLHTYSAMSNSIRETIQEIIETHGTDVVKATKVNVEKAIQMMKNHINGFRTNFNKYIELAKARDLDVSPAVNIFGRIQSPDPYNITKLDLANLRNQFRNIRSFIEMVNPELAISKEILRGINSDLSEIFRYIKLLNLYYIEQEIFEMGLDIEEFKQLLREGNPIISSARFDMLAELQNAIQNLNELAVRKNAEIKLSVSTGEIMLKGPRRSLYTAFYNLLLNAIKYSWIKPDDKKSWVIIEVYLHGGYYHIKFENRGVGISRSDIPRLFQFGSRGEHSHDRSRKGNGIGLWHSKKLIGFFGGEISLTSDPISFNSPTDFKQPFITKVTVKIPIDND